MKPSPVARFDHLQPVIEERNSRSLFCEAIDSSFEDTDLHICRTGVIFCFLDIMLSHLLARCAMKAAKVWADYPFFGAHGVVFFLSPRLIWAPQPCSHDSSTSSQSFAR